MKDVLSEDSCILAASEHNDYFLLDIPRSIELATGVSPGLKLVSCPSIEQPYPGNEPKSERAKARLQKQVSLQAVEHAQAISTALEGLASSHHGEWCLPRTVEAKYNGVPSKRKRPESRDKDDQENDIREHDQDQHDGVNDEWDALREMYSAEHGLGSLQHCMAGGLERGNQETGDEWHGVAINDTDTVQSMHLWQTGDRENAHTFHLPARSASFMADCRLSTASFRASVRNLAQHQDTVRTFDVIVMDPPWPNASVKRGHKRGRGHYSVSDSLWDIRALLLGMDLDMLLGNKDGALVAVWVTNKPTVRTLILGHGGLFDTLGIELIEEWLWIKVTAQGQPVLPVNGLWRKPYEVLLIGRKRTRGTVDESLRSTIGRRVIAAVPDIHSRKPCLKELLESVFRLPSGYRALEIFSRHLVTGWWSWGNEAMKFNDERFWSTSPE